MSKELIARLGMSSLIFKEWRISALLSYEIYLLGIGTPFIVVNPIVEFLAQNFLFAAYSVVKSQTETVALVAFNLLKSVCNPFAVGGILRRAVPCRVVGCKTFGFAAFYRYCPQIAIGICLGILGVVANITNFLGIGRETETAVCTAGRKYR